MQELTQVRQGWDEIESIETRLLRQMTQEESLCQFLALQAEFEPWLQETEPWFRNERNQTLIELQARLLRLNHQNGAVMENLLDSVAALQKLLEEASLPSMVVGGMAVGVWGEPRLTRDVDIKVLVPREERTRLLTLLSGYHPLHENPDEAFRRHGIAFFLDEQGVRVDVMLAETSFDEIAISRARIVEVQPQRRARVCSAEDLIIYKMVSLRTKDRLDVESIVRRQGDRLDDAYILRWLRQFEQALDDSTLASEYRRLRGRLRTP